MMAAAPSEVNLDIQASSPAENTLLKDGDVVSPSCTIFQESQKPADSKKESQKPDKKQTRQWAAWTRQEEENFFNALRQVGKDFEKITYRVQSKNKDQVRHYYYRLVRRMNKLLGPGLCLDAKNSKDTVAAMLRWWSLLEKFSCAASKLHLRPRRFKIFVETLENQLLKDRNKTRRKRPSQGDNSLATSSTTSLISKAATNDARPVKVFVVDSQNSHKVGANKGASLRRNVTPSVTFNKEDLSATKTVKQKRRGVTSASYRRWEKAAIAGVSLVADAAEQLEQAANNHRNCSIDHGNFSATPPEKYTTDGMCPHQIREATPQPSMKLKLQLFPMDEGTRKALEKDAHNPHLELTLSARKRISSVLEHINRKWGNSAKGMGEVMLFPYSAQQEDIGSHRRWTIRDTDATAADVYATVGSPSIFRLRYGWFCSPEVGSGIINAICSKNIEEVHAEDVLDTETVAANIMEHVITTNHFSDPVKFSKHQSTVGVGLVQSVSGTAEPMCGGGSGESEPMCGGSSAVSEPMCGGGSSGSNYQPPNTSGETTFSWQGNSMAQLQDMVNLGTSNATLTPGEWADSLTTISVGDLLSEASKAADPTFLNSSASGQLEQIPFSCDSFDAAIAAHVSGHQLTSLSTEVSHASIWNAEETCDEFSFHNIPAFKGNNLKPLDVSRGACTQVTHSNLSGQYGYHNELPEFKPSEDPSYHNQKTEHASAKQLSYDNKYDPAGDTFLTDIYWPDSLGPFELDMPSSRYQTQDMILGESISVGGLSRLIASSVDAFQNCSFFGMDKKDISW